MGYIRDIEWFPEEYITDSGYYRNFEVIYGFSPYYNRYVPGESPTYVYSSLDYNKEISISGYDKFIKINISSSTEKSINIGTFNIDNKTYTIQQKTDEHGNINLLILDEENKSLLEIPMKDFVDGLFEGITEQKELISPEELTVTTQNENLKVQIIFNEISATKSNNESIYIYGNLFLFVTANK